MDTQTLPKNKETIEQIRRALGYFYDENTNNVYKSKDYTDPITKKHYKNSGELIDELRSYGIPKDASIKKIELIVEQWYETLTKTPDSTQTDTNTVTPDAGVREIQEKERQFRETETLKSQEKAKADEMAFEKRLERIKARVWARPKDKLTEIAITPKNKEFIFEMAQAAKLDEGTTQEYVEGLIKASIPKDKIDEYPENLIENRAHNFVQTVQNFSVYKTANEIPDTLTVTPSYAPLTSLINPNDQKLVNTFTDKFVRENIASDAQQTVLTLSVQRDLDAEIFEPSVFGGDKNLTAVFFGVEEIEKFEPDGNEQSGVEITTEDLQTLHRNNVEVQKFFKKYIEIDSGGAEVVSTGFTPLRIPESEIKSVDTSKVIGKKHILGGIEGEETQGALARRILNEKAKLIDKVVSVNPSTNPLVVQKTKSILSKISSEIVPQTIVKNTALSPIRLGINIGSGTAPLSMELSGNFGGSTQSFLKLMRDTNTPLILTSFTLGAYATSDLAITQAIASQFNGRVLAYIGAGKYSFSVVNAGNTTLGGQLLSRYTAGFQLGSKAFSIEFSQKAGKIISSTLIKTAGGATTRTALPAIISKLANFLGLASGWASFGITTVIGIGIGKLVEWLGPKIKKFTEENKEALLGIGTVGLAIGSAPIQIISVIPAVMGLAGVVSGGFYVSNAIQSVRNIGLTILAFGFTDIMKPLFILFLTTPFIIALILFIIDSGAYVVPPGPLSSNPGSFSSPYIDVQKTSTVNTLKNSDLTKTISYTVTVKPKKGNLTNIKITDNCQVVSKNNKSCPAYITPNTLPNIDLTSPSGGVFTYVMVIDPSFSDSSIINTVTITADTVDKVGVSASASNSITIGNPPISCPLIGGHVTNGSYNGPANTGHGSPSYWQGTGLSRYPIPQSSSCMSPTDCSYYGYAADIFSSGSNDVFAPTVLGKDTSWNCSYAFSNGGGSAGYTYHCLSTDGNAMLVLTHVNKDIKSGTVKSGEKIGTLFNQDGNTHLHLEFQLNGRYVKPESYFCTGK